MFPLHTPVGTPTAAPPELLAAWRFDPLIVLGLALAAAGYAVGLARMQARGRRVPAPWRVAAYYLGLAGVAVALVGPLDTFNDELFSLHMLQHLALIDVAALCLVLGRAAHVALSVVPPRATRQVLRWALRPRLGHRFYVLLTLPLVAFALFNANLVLWHLPPLYDAALQYEALHVIEHLSFFGLALWLWWLILDPLPRHAKLAPHAVFAGSFASFMVCDLIAATLVLASGVLYTPYLVTGNPWGIDPLTDQRIGGAIMWLGGLIWFALMFRTLSWQSPPTERLPR